MPQRDRFFDEGFIRELERLHLIAKRLAARGAPGPRRSRRLGDGLEFADHRAYAPGDDIRFIDWAYFARMERLLLRMFHEHSEAGVTILLDVSASMAPTGDGKLRYACRAAAALAYVAMGSLERIVLTPFADDLRPSMRTGRNRGRIFDVLDFLAALAPGGCTDLPRCVERFCRQDEAPGTVILISDLLDCQAGLSDALARLTRRVGDVTVLHVYSRADASPGITGPVLLQHAETHRQLGISATDELLKSYLRRWGQFVQGCRRTCLGRGATYVEAPTEVPFEKLVLETLRRVGVLSG